MVRKLLDYYNHLACHASHRPFHRAPSAWARRSTAAGFTLIEVTVAAALMSLCATFAYATILVSNRTAVVNRLFTLAQETARNQIDRLECAAPFNPQMNQVPPDLALGIQSQTVPLYVDPTSNATVVTATLTMRSPISEAITRGRAWSPSRTAFADAPTRCK